MWAKGGALLFFLLFFGFVFAHSFGLWHSGRWVPLVQGVTLSVAHQGAWVSTCSTRRRGGWAWKQREWPVPALRAHPPMPTSQTQQTAPTLLVALAQAWVQEYVSCSRCHQQPMNTMWCTWRSSYGALCIWGSLIKKQKLKIPLASDCRKHSDTVLLMVHGAEIKVFMLS